MYRLSLILLISLLVINCTSADKENQTTAERSANTSDKNDKTNQEDAQISGVWTAVEQNDQPDNRKISFEFTDEGTLIWRYDELKSNFKYQLAKDQSKISVFEISGREEPIYIKSHAGNEMVTTMKAFGFNGKVKLVKK